MAKQKSIVPVERIEKAILLVRGEKVLLDRDLAELYGVETKVLKQAVRRNIKRFPSDFMFELTKEEFKNLRSQFVTSSSSQWGGARYLPMAFTEQGVAMLSSVLKSERAIEVNIAIMRAFVRLREMVSTHKKLEAKLSELEHKIENHDENIETIFEAIRQLMTPPEKLKRKIGFDIREIRAAYGKRKKTNKAVKRSDGRD
jgi:hypothetical protein